MSRKEFEHPHYTNLDQRLVELKRKDPAYNTHCLAIADAILYSKQLHRETKTQSVVDCGCGLGFGTAWFSEFFDVVGFDPSEKAIDIAKKEHEGVNFFVSDAQSFPKIMKDQDLEPFDQAILNMVIHSVDDEEAADILKGIKKIIKPEGTVHLIVPTDDWVVQKLVEYAQDQEWGRDTKGIPWMKEKLDSKKVELPMRLTGGNYYPEPLVVYQRFRTDYEKLLTEGGFSVPMNRHDAETEQVIDSTTLPFIELFDHTSGIILAEHNRRLIMSFAFE